MLFSYAIIFINKFETQFNFTKINKKKALNDRFSLDLKIHNIAQNKYIHLRFPINPRFLSILYLHNPQKIMNY